MRITSGLLSALTIVQLGQILDELFGLLSGFEVNDTPHLSQRMGLSAPCVSICLVRFALFDIVLLQTLQV